MTRDDINALRAKACGLVAALGSVIDSLQLIDETLANPDDAFADAVVLSQHLDEAAGTAEQLTECAAVFSVQLDAHQCAMRERAQKLERGDVPATEGGAA
jgi:hypothetical protein